MNDALLILRFPIPSHTLVVASRYTVTPKSFFQALLDLISNSFTGPQSLAFRLAPVPSCEPQSLRFFSAF